jgi:cytochrome c556
MNLSHLGRRTRGKLLLTLAGLCALYAGAAAAEGAAAQSVIEERRAGFKKMGAAMKLIVDQLKTEAPDTANMAPAAQTIAAYAERASGWFPAGSGPEAGADTDARPYIWAERARFDALAEKLRAESGRLAAMLPGSDLGAVKAQVKALGEVCSSCHKSFRAD